MHCPTINVDCRALWRELRSPPGNDSPRWGDLTVVSILGARLDELFWQITPRLSMSKSPKAPTFPGLFSLGLAAKSLHAFQKLTRGDRGLKTPNLETTAPQPYATRGRNAGLIRLRRSRHRVLGVRNAPAISPWGGSTRDKDSKNPTPMEWPEGVPVGLGPSLERTG